MCICVGYTELAWIRLFATTCHLYMVCDILTWIATSEMNCDILTMAYQTNSCVGTKGGGGGSYWRSLYRNVA